ncbi:MAG: hypothetical protein KDE56_33725, partial [Anaerolineales bacterium]|nr:hypothetical protein [Anaerolineales bacterium]
PRPEPIVEREVVERPLSPHIRPRPEPIVEREVVERPLSPHIRLAASLLLLEAFAAARRQSVADFLCEVYGLERVETAVSILINLPQSELAVAPAALRQHVAAIGVNTRTVAELGEQGKELQKYTRQLAAWLKAYDGYVPALHLNTRGGIGQLFDHNNGRIFGLLVGMGVAAAPHQLWIEDPVQMETAAAQ